MQMICLIQAESCVRCVVFDLQAHLWALLYYYYEKKTATLFLTEICSMNTFLNWNKPFFFHQRTTDSW